MNVFVERCIREIVVSIDALNPKSIFTNPKKKKLFLETKIYILLLTQCLDGNWDKGRVEEGVEIEIEIY